MLQQKPLPIHDEKELQRQLEVFLTENGFAFNREYRLSNKDIPDFFIEGVIIEVKIKGNKRAIFDQCIRYLNYPEVNTLILLTSVPIGNFSSLIPPGKDLHIINSNSAWL